MVDDPTAARRSRQDRNAVWIVLAVVPVLALLCCVPASAALGGMDPNCGAAFEHRCLDSSAPVFTTWPWVTGGIAAAAWAGMWLLPRRSAGTQLILGSFVVLPPVLNAVFAFAELRRGSLF